MTTETMHPGHATAAHRIIRGRAHEFAGTDEERAARVAAAHLPWLAYLDDDSRQICLDEVVAALVSRCDLEGLIARWAETALQNQREKSGRRVLFSAAD
jgi:hypothetical protein